MKNKISFLLIGLFIFASTSTAAEEDIVYRLNSLIFSDYLFSTMPGANYYSSFFENYAPDATFLLEESNGFSMIDSPRVCYEGDPFNQFNWYYEGFKINSALNDGSPGFLLPFYALAGFALRGETPMNRNAGLHFSARSKTQTYSQMKISTGGYSLGSYVPWAIHLLNPHASSTKRDDRLSSQRRRINSDYTFDYLFNRKQKNSSISAALTAFDTRRIFNDFNFLDRTFTERGKGVLLGVNFEQTLKEGSFLLTGGFNGISRNHFLAELGRLPQETQNKDRFVYFAGLSLKIKELTLDLSYLREKEKIIPTEPNFLKDLKDNDGEGFWPFEKAGVFSSDVFRANVEKKILSAEKSETFQIDSFAEFKAAVLNGTEQSPDFNPLKYDTSAEFVILWTPGRPYQNTNLEAKAGALINFNLSSKTSLHAKILIQNSSARFMNNHNNISILAPGFDVGILFLRNPEILISYEQMPYELRENVNFFLETQRPWGTIYRWHDLNGDLKYQLGEEGSVFGYTGGQFHSAASNLKIPIKKRWLMTMMVPLSKKIAFSIKGLYKKIEKNYWVEYKEDYGFYEEVNDTNIFFYDKPFRDYVLINDSLAQKPFYAQFLVQIASRENTNWCFSFSFLAHIGMGRTSFGNGAGANDIGILSESQADPNTLINAYGRIDGDRAYLAKVFFGFHVKKNLVIGANIKYRDGTPFAFIETVDRYDQRAFYYKTIKAENERGIKGGPRKDYLTDVSFQIRYSFRLFLLDAEADLSVFNILDVGSELSEYVFSGGARLANELQIPRSLRLSLLIKI